MPKTLFLVEGAPGSTIDPVIDLLAIQNNAVRFNGADFFNSSDGSIMGLDDLSTAHNDCYGKIKAALLSGRNVMVFQCFPRPEFWTEYQNLAVELKTHLFLMRSGPVPHLLQA